MIELSNQPLNTKSRKSAIASPSTFSDPLIVRGSEAGWFSDIVRITAN